MIVSSHSAGLSGFRKWAAISAPALILSAMTMSGAFAESKVHGTYTVVEATGIDIAPDTAIDMDKSMKLKKGQSLILLSPSGERVEVDGPYAGKPADHLVAVPDGDTTMGYDFTSGDIGSHGHCSSAASKPHPTGGPNPDETGGTQNQTSHC